MENERKFFLVLLWVLIVIAVVLIGVQIIGLSVSSQEKSVTIGVIAPLTGSQAYYGQGIKEGLDLAVDEINKNPKNSVKIKLLYEDNAGEIKNSVSAAQKLISIDGVPLIISGVSQHSMAIAPIAQERKVVLFTMASQTSSLNKAGDYVFKNDDELASVGTFMADFIFNRGHKKVGLIYAQFNDAAADAKEAFVKKFNELGGEIVVEGYGKDETDFKSRLYKLNSQKITALFVDGMTKDGVLVLKQINELGLKQEIFSIGSIEDKQSIESIGNAAEGVLFGTFQGIPSKEFSEKIKVKYGHAPLRWSMEAYDGAYILEQALSKIKGEITSDSIKQELSKIQVYQGESGTIHFDKDGNAKRQIYTKVIHNSDFFIY